jgi:hypothetical protein
LIFDPDNYSLCIRDVKEAFSVRARFPSHFVYLELDVRDNEEQNLIRVYPQLVRFLSPCNASISVKGHGISFLRLCLLEEKFWYIVTVRIASPLDHTSILKLDRRDFTFTSFRDHVCYGAICNDLRTGDSAGPEQAVLHLP